MNQDKFSKQIYEIESAMADAAKDVIITQHSRKLVLSHVMNAVEQKLLAAGDKASETKIDRLARDSAEYLEAIEKEGAAVKRLHELTALRNQLTRDYEAIIGLPAHAGAATNSAMKE